MWTFKYFLAFQEYFWFLQVHYVFVKPRPTVLDENFSKFLNKLKADFLFCLFADAFPTYWKQFFSGILSWSQTWLQMLRSNVSIRN